MSIEDTIRGVAFYGPHVHSNPLTWRARLALTCMASGHELLGDLAAATSLPVCEAIDALAELGAHLIVIQAHGRTYYRLGDSWLTREGEPLH